MALFGWDNAVEAAATMLAASSEVAGYEVGLLRVPIGAASTAWQTPSGTTTATLTITSPASISWRAACLARTNLSTGATMRVRVGEPAAFTEATPLFDFSPALSSWTSPGLTQRAHTPSTAMATYIAAGGVLTEAAQHIPRIAYDPTSGARLGMMFEQSRKQWTINPRFEGFVAGTPGTYPSWTGYLSGGSGITDTITSVIAVGNTYKVQVRYSGVANAAYKGFVFCSGAGPTALTAGTKLTQSVYVRLAAGSLANVTPAHWGPIYDTFSTVVLNPDNAFVPTATMTRFTDTRTVPATGTAPYSSLSAGVLLHFVHGATIDVTLEYWMPMYEIGSYATSPMLPPVGTPQATTRADDSFGNTFSSRVSAGAVYSEIIIADGTQAVTEANSVALFDGATSNIIRQRVVTDVPPYRPDSYSLNSGALIYGSANGLTTFGATNRAVTSFSTTLFKYFNNGSAKGNNVGAGALNTNFDSINLTIGDIISYVRSIRIYAPLTDAQALALSGTGSTLIAPAYDSGTISAGVAVGVGQALHVLPTAVSAVAMRVDLSDPTNRDGCLNIPLAYAGPGVEVALAMPSDTGLEVRRDDTTTRGGQIFTSALSRARGWSMKFDALRDADLGWMDGLEATAAQGRNIFFAPRVGNARASSEAVFGLLAPGRRGFLDRNGNFRPWSATILERL